MKILEDLQIRRKIKRMAFEIAESNFECEKIYFLGINNNGFNYAKMLMKSLEKISDKELKLARISLKPQNPVENDISIDIDKSQLANEAIIVVDDVANTGRTLFYAMEVLMDILPAKVETAVLVDRMHKQFPISVNYVGMTLATTIQDNIKVDLTEKGSYSVNLE
ncbi:MAG: phosphoribosyltransferase family protein [Deltaproteobacteria bacterium]